jgi:uncharacterized delta-60 repeat protein
MKTKITLIIAILIAFIGTLKAQPAGTLDPTFNGTGKVVYDKDQTDVYWDVKVQTDGKIVAVGTSFTPSYSSVIEVTRYLTDGSFDPSFGTGGHYNFSLNTEQGAYKCLIKNDGHILVAGYTTDYTTWDMVLIQLDENGVPDPAFGNNGIVLQQLGPQESLIYALAFQEDGKILAAGYSQNDAYNYIPVVLRFSATGVLDSSFGTSGVATLPVTENDNDFSAVSVQSDGKILAAGHISNGLSWFSLLIARFDTNGILDPGYGTGGIVNMNLNNVDDEFYDLGLTADDEAVLAGFTVTQGDLYFHLLLMKFDTAGQPVPSFGTEGVVTYGEVPYTYGDALTMQTDGKILVAGCTGPMQPANNDWAVWRFNADGTPDTGFGTAGIVTTDFFGKADEALGIALYEDKIIVAGKTRNADDRLDFAVARYLDDVGVSVPGPAGKQTFSVSPNPVKRNGPVNVTFEITQAENISVELMNITGGSVLNLNLGLQAAGSHNYQFSLPSGITSGIYMIRVRGSQSLNMVSKLIVSD